MLRLGLAFACFLVHLRTLGKSLNSFALCKMGSGTMV
jgi:hypothetical protein